MSDPTGAAEEPPPPPRAIAAPRSWGRWIDLSVALAAILISICSLFVAWRQSEVMEQTVAAQTWPNVETEINFDRPNALARLTIKLKNNGVGPAHVDSLELWDENGPVTNLRELGGRVKAAGDGRPFKAQVAAANDVGTVLGAGESATVVELATMDGTSWFKPMLKAIDGLQSRVCYCSVLDKCFLSDSRSTPAKPMPVARCPVPAHPYDGHLAPQMLPNPGGSPMPAGNSANQGVLNPGRK